MPGALVNPPFLARDKGLGSSVTLIMKKPNLEITLSSHLKTMQALIVLELGDPETRRLGFQLLNTY